MKGSSYTSTPLWAVRPVQSLSACTRVTFTFTFTSVPVQGCTLPLPLPQCLYKGALYLYLYLSACTRVHFISTFTSVPVQGCTLPLPLSQCLYKGVLYLYLCILTSWSLYFVKFSSEIFIIWFNVGYSNACMGRLSSPLLPFLWLDRKGLPSCIPNLSRSFHLSFGFPNVYLPVGL